MDECPNLADGQINRSYFFCILSHERNRSKLSAWRRYGITAKDAVDKLSDLNQGSPWNQEKFHEELYRNFVKLDFKVIIFQLSENFEKRNKLSPF